MANDECYIVLKRTIKIMVVLALFFYLNSPETQMHIAMDELALFVIAAISQQAAMGSLVL